MMARSRVKVLVRPWLSLMAPQQPNRETVKTTPPRIVSRKGGLGLEIRDKITGIH